MAVETKIGEIFMGHEQRRGYKSERLKLSRNSVQGYAFRPNSFLQQGFFKRGGVDII